MSDYDFDPTAAWDDCGSNDPDSHSPRMQYYNQRLWSHRPLNGRTDGRTLILEPYDHGLLDTGLGETFFGLNEGLYLKSDRWVANWGGWGNTERVRADPQLNARVLATSPVLNNMGGVVMWPGRQVGGQSLNQERGFGQKARIADRPDLTLECIRLAWAGTFAWEANPLGPALQRYWEFFALFGGFRGYVEFWLLQDLLTEDGQRVKFLMEGDLPDGWDFRSRSPFPASVEAYDEYLRNAQEVVLRRNDRMREVWRAQSHG